MKVWVLIDEPEHENSTILGVYATEAAANVAMEEKNWRHTLIIQNHEVLS